MTSSPNKLAIAAVAFGRHPALGAAVLFVRGHTAPASDGRRPSFHSRRTGFRAGGNETHADFGPTDHGGAGKRRTRQGGGGGGAGGRRRPCYAQIPIGLMAKLPLEFKQAGMAMHAGFDDIAAAVNQGESPSALTGQLAIQLSACVGCHQSYRIDSRSLKTRGRRGGDVCRAPQSLGSGWRSSTG